MPFQYYMRSVCDSVDSFKDEYISDDTQWISKCCELGKAIYSYVCKDAEICYKTQTMEKDIEGYKAVVINKERFNPSSLGIDYHKDGYDISICFWYKNKWTFSIYNEDGKVDCSQIAKKFGGGGHAGAAGWAMDKIEDFIKL